MRGSNNDTVINTELHMVEEAMQAVVERLNTSISRVIEVIIVVAVLVVAVVARQRTRDKSNAYLYDVKVLNCP